MLHDNQFFYLGLLFFAFTVFSAYNEFAQYFVVWNGNVPEETFWYLIRERGSWWCVSMVLIFGHFFVPFFLLLSVKAKTNFKIVLPVCAWAWLMHFVDLSFNILPALPLIRAAIRSNGSGCNSAALPSWPGSWAGCS